MYLGITPAVYRHQIDPNNSEHIDTVAAKIGYERCWCNEYKVCPDCGLLQWAMGHEEKPDGENLPRIVFKGFGSDDTCSSCRNAIQRAPEVAGWVIGVVKHALFKLKKEAEENSK